MALALVDRDLRDFVNNHNIVSLFDLNDYVQPASIDLPLSDTAYLVKEKVLPFNKKISNIIDDNTIQKISLKEGAVLLKGQTYLIPCVTIDFPENYFASISPKSSIGRIDLMVRAIFDNSGLYDSVPLNRSGQLWLEVTPQSFNVKVKAGIPVSQIRIFKKSVDEDTCLDLRCEDIVYDSRGKLLDSNLHQDKVVLNLEIPKASVFGYEAIETSEVIDMTKIKNYDWRLFFREIKSTKEGKFTLEKDRFYIVATKEGIRVPSYMSAEMVPFSHLLGELRAHYAGFFDPGWGNKDGDIGVLEIRPHESITVYDGQPICMMEYFKNQGEPDRIYGDCGNNYAKQSGPRLAKYFKE